MQIKYSKTMRKKVITIEMETINFTPQETKLLDEYGEPTVKFSKIYNGKFPVDFEKRIRTGFKLKVRFDGTEDIQGAAAAANMFFEEIQEKMADLMSDKIYNSVDADFTVESGLATIKY